MRNRNYTAIFAVTLAGALPATASADTLYVSPTGSTTATVCPSNARCSIEHAVEDLADPDDVVEAEPGNYNVATLTIQDKISLRGQPGAEKPRIVGTSQPLAVAFAGDGATIQDVTVDLVGNGTAVVLGGAATIERSLILGRGPGNVPADADALFSASGGTLRDTTIRVNRSPAAASHPTVLASVGTLALRNVTVERQDDGTESAVGVGTSGTPSIDADGLVIKARRSLTLGGAGHSVVHDLTASQPPGSNFTTGVVAFGTTQIDGAVIHSNADQGGAPGALVADDATLSDATIDAPGGEAVRLDDHARLDRSRITGLNGIDMFGAAAVTNTLVKVTSGFAGRYGGPGPLARVVNSTLVGESGSVGFRKDSAGTVALLNTILAAGTDIELNGGSVAARNSRFATVTGSGLTDQGGNLAAGPQFVDPTVADYRLQSNSPMVDAGATDDILGPLDLGGLPRISGPAPDMGAFEFQHPAPADPPTPAPEQPGQGGSGGGSSAAPVEDLATTLSGASLRPRSFAAGSRTTRLRFTLSEPAAVSLTTARELPGRVRGGRCVKPTRALRRAKRCTRLQRTGPALKVEGRVGGNSVPFTGRGLKPGPHRVTLVPTDAAGHRGQPSSVRFAIVSRRKKR